MTASMSGSSVLDPALIERVASDLRSEASLVELFRSRFVNATETKASYFPN